MPGMTTKTLRAGWIAGTVGLGLLLSAGTSCSSDQKSDAAKGKQSPSAKSAKAGGEVVGTREVAVTPGEAGGVVEETVTETVTVRAIDTTARTIALQLPDGTTAHFTAGPELRNFDQLKVGDRIRATAVSRLSVFVDREGPAGPASAEVLARSPKGAKPGGLVAQTYEVVGTVKSIDTGTRRAVLEFSDGTTKTVPVRKDVDLSRYKPGDNVVIQVTQQLTVVTESP